MADRAVKDYGLDPNRVAVCYPLGTVQKNDAGNALGHLFTPGYKHIVYSGALGEKQAPYQLLELFQTIVKRREDVMCHIFSRGQIFNDLQREAGRNIGRIKFHDLVPEENLYELYLRSNVQVIPQVNGTAEGAIPSKLPNIIKAGTPIFAKCEEDSDLARLIEQAGIGICVHSWDIRRSANQLESTLRIFAGQSHEERQRVVRDFVSAKFGIKNLIQEILT
jgi:colanic acid biosynthesis glycosyl transferase WcaI